MTKWSIDVIRDQQYNTIIYSFLVYRKKRNTRFLKSRKAQSARGCHANTAANEEVFVKVHNIGFVFYIDKRLKHNLISPAFLAWFNIGRKPPRQGDTFSGESVDPARGSDSHFVHDRGDTIDLDSFVLDSPFRYVGRQAARCCDNKMRRCKAFRFELEYDGRTFSFPFCLDGSCDKPAILSKEAFCHMTL